jgi:thioredoxin reductase
LVGRRQAIAEQRRYKRQVRFNGSQQGGPPIVGDHNLNTAPVVVGCAARDQARLLHPDKQPAHTAFAEQHAIPQLFLTRPHARQVGEVDEDVEPLQRQLVLTQHLIGKLLDDVPVRSEKGLPKGGLVIQLRERLFKLARYLRRARSGSELATRATVQARRFGAELLLARPLVGVSADGPCYVAGLSDGTLIRGRAVLLASGVEWRRLDVPGVDDLLGAGVYYGAGPSEALACTDSQVVVVGGGNSAGQAVVRFSRYAKQVTLLVRGRDLGASMSQYLIDQVTAIPNAQVRMRTQVVGLEAEDRLRAVIVRSGDSAEPVRVPADALFICSGGVPRTDGATGIGLVTDAAGYLLTGSDAASDPGASWPLRREPLPLETSQPGVFAAGDVRCGSVKRCSAAIGEGSMAVALVHRRLAELGGE